MDNKYIGILTSGGDASGMNAAIPVSYTHLDVYKRQDYISFT